jgi:large subunit ribosomal protein L13
MKPKTTVTKGNQVNRKWHLVDVSGKTLGRVATGIAQLLIGKTVSGFSFHRDDGDYVVVINSDKVLVTGKKAKNKIYYHYTGFAGNLKETTFEEMMAKDSRKVIHHAVMGMIPKNRIRKNRMARLKIFADANHHYEDKIKQ